MPVHPLRPRSSVSVLVLNGNGVSGAAGSLATRLGASGYRSATAADAPRQDYARSVVLYRPGWVREARRLAHDAGVHGRRAARRDDAVAAPGSAARHAPRGQLGGHVPSALWRALSRMPHGVPVGPCGS